MTGSHSNPKVHIESQSVQTKRPDRQLFRRFQFYHFAQFSCGQYFFDISISASLPLVYELIKIETPLWLASGLDFRCHLRKTIHLLWFVFLSLHLTAYFIWTKLSGTIKETPSKFWLCHSGSDPESFLSHFFTHTPDWTTLCSQLAEYRLFYKDDFVNEQVFGEHRRQHPTSSN